MLYVQTAYSTPHDKRQQRPPVCRAAKPLAGQKQLDFLLYKILSTTYSKFRSPSCGNFRQGLREKGKERRELIIRIRAVGPIFCGGDRVPGRRPARAS